MLIALLAQAAFADVQYSIDRLVEKLARDAAAAAAEPIVGRIPVSLLAIKNEGPLAAANYVGEAVRALAQKSLTLSLVFYEVDRENLSESLKEMELALSGIVDDATIPKIGAIEGVVYLISGSVTEAGGDFIITLQLIHLETSKIVSSAQATIARADMVAAADIASFQYITANGVGLGFDGAGAIAFGLPSEGQVDGPSMALEGALSYRFSKNWRLGFAAFFQASPMGKDNTRFGDALNLTMRDQLITELTIDDAADPNDGMIPRRRSDGSIDYVDPVVILDSRIYLDRSLSFYGLAPMLLYVIPFSREFSLNMGGGGVLSAVAFHTEGSMPGYDAGVFMESTFVIVDLWKFGVGGRAECSFEWFVAPRLALSFGARFVYDYVLWALTGSYAYVNNERVSPGSPNNVASAGLFGLDPFQTTDGNPAFQGINPMSLNIFFGLTTYF